LGWPPTLGSVARGRTAWIDRATNAGIDEKTAWARLEAFWQEVEAKEGIAWKEVRMKKDMFKAIYGN